MPVLLQRVDQVSNVFSKYLRGFRRDIIWPVQALSTHSVQRNFKPRALLKVASEAAYLSHGTIGLVLLSSLLSSSIIDTEEEEHPTPLEPGAQFTPCLGN